MKSLFSVAFFAMALISCNGVGTTQSVDSNTAAAPSLSLEWKSDTIFTGSESTLQNGTKNSRGIIRFFGSNH